MSFSVDVLQVILAVILAGSLALPLGAPSRSQAAPPEWNVCAPGVPEGVEAGRTSTAMRGAIVPATELALRSAENAQVDVIEQGVGGVAAPGQVSSRGPPHSATQGNRAVGCDPAGTTPGALHATPLAAVGGLIEHSGPDRPG